MTVGLVIGAALINWFATDMLVTGEIFSPLRNAVIRFSSGPLIVTVKRPGIDTPIVGTVDEVNKLLASAEPTEAQHWAITTEQNLRKGFRGKLGYFVQCQMCTGTWVGFAEAAFFGATFGLGGFLGTVAAGLLFKAGGHLVLEAVALGRSIRGEQ